MKKLPFIHPFLFALYPVFFLYANNLSEFRDQVLIAPIILVTIFAAVVYGILFAIFRKLEQSAIVSSAILVICLSYTRLLESFKDTTLNLGTIQVNAEALFLLPSILFVALVIYAVKRYRKSLRSMNTFLTLIAVILVGFSIYTSAAFEIKEDRLLKPTPKKGIASSQVKNINPNQPDIYYFIFDRYAGQKSLSDQYHFDNSQLLNFLKGKGFYVATDSTTNYPKTFLSLSSSLNMEYLDFLTEKTHGGASSDESVATPYIQNNKVLDFLKSKGYSTVNIGMWWEPTKTNPNADINYVYNNGGYFGADDFTTGFLNTTIAAPILQKIFYDPMDVSKSPFTNLHRKMIFYDLATIKTIPQLLGPKFVFMHILFPHDPFVVDKNCKPIPETITDHKVDVDNYLNQLQCANIQMEKVVDTILATSKKPPVIIIQADEGPYPMIHPLDANQSWSTTDHGAWQEKFPILNAYYFPGQSTDKLYPTITPVNSFRMLFNTYFGTNYQLLPDKNFIFKDGSNYYKFTDVTSEINR